MSRFYVGLDLGQARDFSAATILEKIPAENEDEQREYHQRYLHRYPLGTSYADVCRDIRRMVEEPELRRQSVVVMDLTGVGRPIQDLFREMHLFTIGITITGGDKPHRDGANWSVPKRDLVSNLAVLFQNGQLKIAAELALAETLKKELLGFRVHITPAGQDTYEAWREGQHDDLVLVTAIAAWYAEQASGVYIV